MTTKLLTSSKSRLTLGALRILAALALLPRPHRGNSPARKPRPLRPPRPIRRPIQRMSRFTSSTCRAMSTCWSAPAATSRCRSATTACCWWTPVSPARATKFSPPFTASPTSRSATSSTRTSIPTTPAATKPSPSRQYDRRRQRRRRYRRERGNQAAILAFQTVLDRMSAPTGQQAPTPQGAWPTETYTTPERKLFFNGEAVQVIHIPDAHTDGDSIVFFHRSDVISTGDIFVTNRYPIVDIAHGGNIQGIIAGLNRIIELATPGPTDEGGTLIVPGHGRLCDQVRRRLLPGNGHHHSRPRSGHDQ